MNFTKKFIVNYEIKIYGEIVPFQDSWISESGYCNLSFVQRQLSEANGQDVTVRINSFGGDVDEGFAIYSELRRYAKENNAEVTTLAEGRCASIATVIFLAGDKRLVTEYTEPFVHNAWCYAMGDSKEITRVAADLEKCNDKIAKHYEIHTNLTYKEARELMDNETSITAEECVSLRFATEIEEVFRPVALQKILKSKLIKNQIEMSKSKKGSLLAMFKKALGFQNKIVFTADEKEVDFYELEDTDTPKVGDKANIDGNDNYSGEVVMADGKTYVFTSGELTEIKDGEQGAEDEASIEEVQKEVEDIATDIEEIKEVLEAIVEEVVPEIANLKKENSRLNSALAKLKGVEPEAPKGNHDRNKNKKESGVDLSKLNVKLKNR